LRNYIKDDGFFIFAIPMGLDTLYWNAHRVYGRKRFPIMIRSWDYQASYYLSKKVDIEDYLDFDPNMVPHPYHIITPKISPR